MIPNFCRESPEIIGQKKRGHIALLKIPKGD